MESYTPYSSQCILNRREREPRKVRLFQSHPVSRPHQLAFAERHVTSAVYVNLAVLDELVQYIGCARVIFCFAPHSSQLLLNSSKSLREFTLSRSSASRPDLILLELGLSPSSFRAGLQQMDTDAFLVCTHFQIRPPF